MKPSHANILLPLIIFSLIMLIGTAGAWTLPVCMAVAGLFAVAVMAIVTMVRTSHRIHGRQF